MDCCKSNSYAKIHQSVILWDDCDIGAKDNACIPVYLYYNTTKERNMMRKPDRIRRRTTHDAAIDAIRDYIIKNRLKVGASLPTEHELCAFLGVSRNILREAMRHFRTLGIITSKAKTGAVIARLMPENPFEGYMPFIAAQGKCQSELVEARQVIEVGAVPFILSNKTEKDVKELRQLAGEMRLKSGAAECAAPDILFHSKLIRMTGNRILESIIPLIVNFFEQNKTRMAARKKKTKIPAMIADEHLAIADAVGSGDAERLKLLIIDHYDNYLNS
jgi:DNA-binding FadR family transcriptional regulator